MDGDIFSWVYKDKEKDTKKDTPIISPIGLKFCNGSTWFQSQWGNVVRLDFHCFHCEMIIEQQVIRLLAQTADFLCHRMMRK